MGVLRWAVPTWICDPTATVAVAWEPLGLQLWVGGGLRITGERAGARLSCVHSVCWRALWAGLCPALLLCQ